MNLGKLEDLYLLIVFIIKKVVQILCVWHIAKTGGLLGVVCLFAFSYCVIAISYAIGKTNSSIKVVKSKGYRKAMREQKQREFEENWPVLK